MRRAAGVMWFVACALGCEGSKSGATCASDVECSGTVDLVCVATGSESRCMRRCSLATDWICSDGTVCLAVEAGEFCWNGGHTPIYSGCSMGQNCACTADRECEAGTVCVEGVCRQACPVTSTSPQYCSVDPFCAYKEACVAEDGRRGHCALLPASNPIDAGCHEG